MLYHAAVMLPLIASLLSLSEQKSIAMTEIRNSEPLFNSLSYLSSLYNKRTGIQSEASRVQQILSGAKRKDSESEIVEGRTRFGNKNCFFSLVQCSFYYR
ncbi:hypothetical protein Tcan_11844 [Toxocara canis]|uniref:Uncharacterized protein n=1 Tax=Toxocara canis TaxID=6265 RepID=A0A0B2W392_TOXCA|nr:hypothetical protein Tcan_11844 [Toxocara canis]